MAILAMHWREGAASSLDNLARKRTAEGGRTYVVGFSSIDVLGYFEASRVKNSAQPTYIRMRTESRELFMSS